ncbi:hypothetical protein SDC9_143725 [bioreactor metagenome]|uniref:Uncharacterized protein n=1 Tax=bioreactor metagenome TaxID=1076179 RepID=A0A645E4Q7_9ZZZZ
MEDRVLGKFAGQQATGQGHPHNDPHALFPGYRKQQLMRTLTEHVVNDLNGSHAFIFHGLQAFLNPLHADAEMLDLAFLL